MGVGRQQTNQQSSSSLRRHRRAIVFGTAVVVLLLVVVLATVSWHFSSAVVVPDHADWAQDTSVDGLASGRVVLARSHDSQRPGIYGLYWQAGHAIVGEVLGGSANSVTRQLCSEDGYLVTGMKAALDPDVYVGNPRQSLGLAYSNVLIPDELGPMPAWFIPGRTDTWVILVHGINGNPNEGLRIAPALHKDGLSSLVITYREDLGAPKSPDGLHHMGLTEWRDLAAAARYALSHGAQRLVLMGYSMGGAIVTQFMEHSPLAKRVAGLVLDAPALSWKAILSFNATEMGLPSFAALPVEWAIGTRVDADWNSLDALQHTSAFHLPILLFHGTDDRLVPISTSDQFAKALPGWVTYYRVPDAGHTEAWNVDPAQYEQRLTTFLSRVVGVSKSTTPSRGTCGSTG